MKKLIFFSIFLAISTAIILLNPLSVSSAVSKQTPAPRIYIQYDASSRNAAPKTCQSTTNDQVANYSLGGWRLAGIIDYKFNSSTVPKGFSRQTAFAIIERSFATVQSAGDGILFHYAGESSERQPTSDNQNTVMWRALPSGVAAVTYIWTDNGRLVDADTVFNNVYFWSYTDYTGTNDCGGNPRGFDIRDVATHEFGHWVGLNDLYDTNSRDLTMYGYAARGELKKDTLGLGDILGVQAVWP